jgi:alanine or glycine:cation symporter, AGCS family
MLVSAKSNSKGILIRVTGHYMLNEAGTAIATIDGNTGVSLTSAAFGSAIRWLPYVLALAVILFAFSTMISWSY